MPVQPAPAPVHAAMRIPDSVRSEHHAIHAALERATRVPGPVGAAARELAKVLHPHFVREEEIALPPLGALALLASGQPVDDPQALLRMTDQLKMELPRMLQEHGQIREAVNRLRVVARAERQPEYERLADDLAQHAQAEEDVFYPAAVLAGELVRLRSATP